MYVTGAVSVLCCVDKDSNAFHLSGLRSSNRSIHRREQISSSVVIGCPMMPCFFKRTPALFTAPYPQYLILYINVTCCCRSGGVAVAWFCKKVCEGGGVKLFLKGRGRIRDASSSLLATLSVCAVVLAYSHKLFS